MATFRKLKLISEEELERLKQRQLEQYEPNLRLMARLQNQIESILSSSDEKLSANERLNLLEMLKNRFRDIKSKSEANVSAQATQATAQGAAPTPAVEAVVNPLIRADDEEQIGLAGVEAAEATRGEELVAKIDSKEYEEPLIANLIVSTISKRKQKEARDKFDTIIKYPNILRFNEKFEAVVHGRAIPGSNFSELFQSLFSKSGKSSSLPGFNDFQNALTMIDIQNPRTPPIATRTRSVQQVDPSSLTGTPPGIKPDIKHVYQIK